MEDPGERSSPSWRTVLGGGSESSQVRFAVLGLAEAVEASMRRALREDPGAPASLRLRVLDPARCSFDELVAALLRGDRISSTTLDAARQLRKLAERLRTGGPPSAGDSAAALHLVDRIERELSLFSASAAPVPGRAPEVVAVPVVPTRRPRIRWPWSLAALALVLLLFGALWWMRAQRKELERGIALYEQGALEEADVRLRRSLGWRGDPETLWYLARIQGEAGSLDSAAVLLRRAVRLDPKDARAHRELGAVLMELGRYDAAVERFRAAIELEPESAPGWFGLVRSLRAAGRDRAAARVLERAPAAARERFLAPEQIPIPPQEIHGRT